MSKEQRKKLCYILIFYDSDTYRHYLYLYKLIDSVSRAHDVRLIIERTKGTPDFPHVRELETLWFQNSVLRKIELFWRLIRARLGGYRIFYSHYSYMAAILAGVITRLTGGRSYFWHCIMINRFLNEPERMRRNAAAKKVSDWIFRFRLRLAIKLVHHPTIGTPFMADYYSEILGLDREKFLILPNWVDPDRFDPVKYDRERIRAELGYKQENEVLLFVHGLYYGKGAHRLPEILDGTFAARPNARAIVVGGGRDEAIVRNGVIERGLQEKTLMLSDVPNREVPRYYAAADLFIMPSMFEAFSRTLLEAMSMGLPFAATDGGGGTYDYTHPAQHDFIVPADDASKFIERSVRLLGDSQKRAELSRTGRDFVQFYKADNAYHRFVRGVLFDDPQPFAPDGTNRNQ